MSSIYKIFFILAIIGSLLCSLSINAFAEEDLKFDLEQIVVTATKTSKQVKNAPATVEVITAEDMKKQNVKRISDAIKLLPGVYVREPKGLMGTADTESISIRGFVNDTYSGEQYIVFLMDGKPMSISDSVNFSNIPIENIDRIEVTKGASSALYGSNAMGGVINIITKEKPENATTIKATIGEMGTKMGAISNSGFAGKLDYFLYAKHTETDGYTTDLNYLKAAPGSLKAKYPGKNGMDSESYNARMIYHFDEKSHLGISVSRNNHSYFWEYKPDIGNRDEISWSLDYENQINERNLFKISYTERKEDKNSVMSPLPKYLLNTSEATVKNLELQNNYQISAKDLLTIGYAYKEDEFDSFQTLLDPESQGIDWNKRSIIEDKKFRGKTTNQAIYLQNEHRFDNQFTLYVGARYDNWHFKDADREQYINTQKVDEEFPNMKATSFSPKVALTYQPSTRLTLRTSVGKAFRAPNIRELIEGWESDKAKYIPNSSLKPEESTNYEIGADYQFDRNLFGRISIFRTDFDNRITNIVTYDPTIDKDVSRKANANKSKIKGIELGLNKRWDERWTGFVNYTYTDAKIEKSRNNPEMEGKQIDNVPKNMFNIGLNYQQDHWQANLTGNYVSDPCEDRGKTVIGRWDSYFVMDLKVSYQFNEDTQLSLSVDNLLDREYFSSFLAQPRTTYLEFSQKF